MIVVCPNCGAKNNVDPAKAAQATPRCGKCHQPLPVSTAEGTDGHPVEITDENFQSVLTQAGDKPVLVDAWATWCPPCRMLAPTIDQIAQESNGRWVVGKLDTDKNPQTAMKYNVTALPTVLIFKRGQLVDQLVGLQPKQNIVAKLTAGAR